VTVADPSHGLAPAADPFGGRDEFAGSSQREAGPVVDLVWHRPG
jgi:hypothetical protein